ncbi:MAG: hypothetical protein ACRDRK_27285 [Pseudonocardia sp.]
MDRKFLDALISVGRGRLDLVVQTLNMYRPIVAAAPGAWQMLLHATGLNHSPSVVVGALPIICRTIFEHDAKTVLRAAFMRPVLEAFQIAIALDDHGLRAFVRCRALEELAEYPRVFGYNDHIVLKIISGEKTAVELARLIQIFRSMRTNFGNYYARLLISYCGATTNARDLADALRREGLRKDAKHFDGIWARRNRH